MLTKETDIWSEVIHNIKILTGKVNPATVAPTRCVDEPRSENCTDFLDKKKKLLKTRVHEVTPV